MKKNIIAKEKISERNHSYTRDTNLCSVKFSDGESQGQNQSSQRNLQLQQKIWKTLPT
jgi:hypothetical protein